MSAQAREMGEGTGVWIEGNHKGISIRDFEGDRGGHRSHVGKSNLAGMETGL